MTRLENLFLNPDRAIDPVCGMHVDKMNPRGGTILYEGTSYYFCADGCRKAFGANPEGFVSH